MADAQEEPKFFSTPAKFGAWLKTHHAKRGHLLVGYHKVGTGKPSMTWTESVQEALCWGWIDGVRRSLGDEAYTIRFTPRKTGSHWSLVNVRHAERLVQEGRMEPAGLAAFEARSVEKTGRASFEQGDLALKPAQQKRFKADKAAWAWFTKSAPGSYRKAAIWWILSAKKPETAERRLAQLIEHSRQEKPLPQYSWRRKSAE